MDHSVALLPLLSSQGGPQNLLVRCHSLEGILHLFQRVWPADRYLNFGFLLAIRGCGMSRLNPNMRDWFWFSETSENDRGHIQKGINSLDSKHKPKINGQRLTRSFWCRLIVPPGLRLRVASPFNVAPRPRDLTC